MRLQATTAIFLALLFDLLLGYLIYFGCCWSGWYYSYMVDLFLFQDYLTYYARSTRNQNFVRSGRYCITSHLSRLYERILYEL